MFKKITAAAVALIITVCIAGCSGGYVMTEEDLALQKKIEGYWVADTSTGYNQFDENGNLAVMIVIEFTDSYQYLMHQCFINEGYALSREPIAYSFEEEKFKVMVDGVATYAGVNFSEDGQTMYWITDEKTDTYLKISAEEAYEFGIPEYDPQMWTETESVSGDSNTESVQESVSGDSDTESVQESVSGSSDTESVSGSGGEEESAGGSEE